MNSCRGEIADHTMNVPYPPDDLMVRIGVSPEAFPTREAREEFFADIGHAVHECVRDAIPYEEGQAILDFGCGSGRVLRWFASEPGVHVTGCDIHGPSIAWMQAHAPSTVRLYTNESAPPLPEADASFDVIYCGSVFSHVTEWAPWLLELRRILKPGGVLVASLHGRGFWHLGFHGDRGVPWDEDDTGMLVEHYGDSFDDGWGPAVYVSEWWVREHWGRALDISRFEPTGFGMRDNPAAGQAWVVARKPVNASALTVADLESPSTDARETTAALRGRQLAYEEVEDIANYARSLSNENALARSQVEASLGQQQTLEARIADLSGRLRILENSRSWNLTRPLRAVAHRVRVAKH
jgi:SAM-dependent methyltransferase